MKASVSIQLHIIIIIIIIIIIRHELGLDKPVSASSTSLSVQKGGFFIYLVNRLTP